MFIARFTIELYSELTPLDDLSEWSPFSDSESMDEGGDGNGPHMGQDAVDQ